MENRNRLRQTKKQIIHQKIQRKNTNHNRTRLLQPHILLNLLIGIKHDEELKITRKPKETTKYTYE